MKLQVGDVFENGPTSMLWLVLEEHPEGGYNTWLCVLRLHDGLVTSCDKLWLIANSTLFE